MSESRVKLEDLKPNSYKSKEEGLIAPTDKRTEKVISGSVIEHKRSFASKFTDAFFDGDFKTAANFALIDVLFPAIKRGIADTFQNLVEMMLFGVARPKSSKGGGERVSYASYYKSDAGSNRRNDNAYRNTRHDYRDIVLSTRGEAEEVIDVLTGIVEEYRQATVSDLYDAVGITGDFTDAKYGWTNLSNAKIRMTRDGYLLDLPRAIPLD